MHHERHHTRTLRGREIRFRADGGPVLIGPRTARFRDPSHRTVPLPPFPALLNEPAALGPAPLSFPVRPLFADAGCRRTIAIDGAPGTSYYGTGECCGPLERSGRSVVCWNTDCFGYDDKTPSLYQSHPWVLAVRRDGTAYGVMVETTYRCRVTTGLGIVFECKGHSPGVIVIDRDSPQDVVKRLAELTGFMPMPPKWALGYEQCRWSYEPESRVREIARQFRERRIPCDVIWLDIDYMDGFRCFTVDEGKFPEPQKLNDDLHKLGFKTVFMIDPGIKVDPAYTVYAAGRKGGHFVTTAPALSPTQSCGASVQPASTQSTRTPGSPEYHGSVWPGPCAFPDFTNASTRDWWAGLHSEFLALGIDGIWNDMNEPAVFDGTGKSMPETCRHRADAELGGSASDDSHARYHNVYGMQMARATREGIERARPDRRPFVLTRSNFLGGHRYAATWTGDNTSDWKHLAWSIPMVVNLGLSGQPFSGPDIGGFIGNATGNLFARWMGIGALLPFARGHSTKDSKDHEPWSFCNSQMCCVREWDEDDDRCTYANCEEDCREALERRYRLLPYLYTLFYEAHTTGLPVVRPVLFADATDPKLRTVDASFLLGSDLLVECDVGPVRILSRARRPRGTWRELDPLGVTGLNQPRLLLRAGAIVPLGPKLQFTGERPIDPLTLVASTDGAGRAEGVLYEDAGDGNGYAAGDFALTRYVIEGGRLTSERVAGSRAALARRVETIMLG